jgi:hypothetical protein
MIRLLLFSSLFLAAACQSQGKSRTEVSGSENLRPLIVQPEELGWTDGSSSDSTSIFELPLMAESKEALGVRLSPFPSHPRYGAPDDHRVAIQYAFTYGDTQVASQVFNKERDLMLKLGGWESYDGIFDPGLENSFVGCREQFDGEFGQTQVCIVMVQYDRYLIQGSMLIDEQVITMQDWVIFLELIQVKLLERTQ